MNWFNRLAGVSEGIYSHDPLERWGYPIGTERFRLTLLLFEEVYTGFVASSAPPIALSLNDARESRIDSRVLPQASVDTAGVRSIRIKSYRTFEKSIQ
jgi:hypothetical protein